MASVADSGGDRVGDLEAASLRVPRNTLLLDPADNVLVAVAELPAGLRFHDGEAEIVLSEPVPLGHKLARRRIDAGCKIIKYGASIGSATSLIPAGAWVHLHNLASDYLATPAVERAP